jgi:hypothetical protein
LRKIQKLPRNTTCSEKFTINRGFVGFAPIDLTALDGFHADRTDSPRTATRNALDRNTEALSRPVNRKTFPFGFCHYSHEPTDTLRTAKVTT